MSRTPSCSLCPSLFSPSFPTCRATVLNWAVPVSWCQYSWWCRPRPQAYTVPPEYLSQSTLILSSPLSASSSFLQQRFYLKSVGRRWDIIAATSPFLRFFFVFDMASFSCPSFVILLLKNSSCTRGTTPWSFFPFVHPAFCDSLSHMQKHLFFSKIVESRRMFYTISLFVQGCLILEVA